MDEPQPLAVSDSLVLEGVLLRENASAVKLLVGGLCVEVLVDDLEAIEELHPDFPPDFGIPVWIRLHRPAQVLDIGPAWPYAGFLKGGQRTFASSSRPWSSMSLRSSHYRELEQEFMRKHGLETKGEGA